VYTLKAEMSHPNYFYSMPPASRREKAAKAQLRGKWFCAFSYQPSYDDFIIDNDHECIVMTYFDD
jgi:hypothetical protein